MNKETTVAIILGIAAGIAIALFVIFGSRKDTASQADVIGGSITPTVVLKQPVDDAARLVISTPENDVTVDTDTLSVKGTAAKGALIVIQSPAGELTFRNETEAFTKEVTLLPGENQIRITSYDLKNIDSKVIVVYYLEK